MSVGWCRAAESCLIELRRRNRSVKTTPQKDAEAQRSSVDKFHRLRREKIRETTDGVDEMCLIADVATLT
uniref:Uncharacterized protein n=1 Tax=Plectus sambesii TaxID=2011161 RepID=A0A914X1U9_9BILA